MIQSMTGFGKSEKQTEFGTLIVDLRSVNNRYCDMAIKLPEFLESHSEEIKRLLTEKLVRGRITLSVSLNGASEEIARLKLNLPAIRRFYDSLTELSAELGIDEKVKIEHLLMLTDLFDIHSPNIEAENVITILRETLESAIVALNEMRFREGNFLQKELELHLVMIGEKVSEIEDLFVSCKNGYFEKMKKNLKELCADLNFDTDRVLQEAALAAKRIDITEECERLRSHLHQFRKYMEDDEPSGKKMTFLLQEMNREAATIGSKSEEARIAHLVVLVKDEIEKIREQAQNIL
ncbi:MAG: YicC family protein [Candidatus Marinimicrobia bacterium CG08_land_8_20_14_0_20_45_22]|nr:MAG: YicC family protein [Candidatus Marinimicrobia bacterium CG08_land_8_20_14_0_20_45_22]